jgi:hypothetical protein
VSEDQTFALILIVTTSVIYGVLKIIRGPIGAALARRISGSVEGDGRQNEEINELRTRVAELEERVDFTERVLLQQPERGQVPAGGEQQR